MSMLLAAIVALVSSALLALALGRSPRAATACGVAGAVAAAGLGLVPVVGVLAAGADEGLGAVWAMPMGSLALGLDALSALFLVPVLLLSALAAIYGAEYLAAFRERASLGAAWFWLNLLVASMVLVLIARNGLLFLVAWEGMALTSFFLVAFESGRREVREAAWVYLLAAHLGAACLLPMFALLGGGAALLDFSTLGRGLSPSAATVCFLLALVGFGSKAGIVPFHVWLPEAHPAAPSHVSALMSGVMIKTGVYGLIRVLAFLGPPPLWWGVVLVLVGVSSGLLGVSFALAQHDLKRLLAYSSVENIGIIFLGLGAGVLGIAAGAPAVAVLGFGGALLHVVNHALFKGLLFLGAGAVLHGAHTRDIDRLGGLLRRLPFTGLAFAVGATAIVGLPPLNGFVGELLLMLAAWRGVTAVGAAAGSTGALPALAVVMLLLLVAALAAIGGLAAACFAKAFGIVFLGEPRSAAARAAHECGPAMRWPMLGLAAGCLLVGLTAPWIVGGLGGAIAAASGLAPAVVAPELAFAVAPLFWVAAVATALLALVALLALARRGLLARRAVTASVTWDCGYAAPSARMQYTGSSFAQPLVDLAAVVLRPRLEARPPRGLFPAIAAFASATPDFCRERLFAPLFSRVAAGLGRLHFLQQGRAQLYVLTIAVTLLALLVWEVW